MKGRRDHNERMAPRLASPGMKLAVPPGGLTADVSMEERISQLGRGQLREGRKRSAAHGQPSTVPEAASRSVLSWRDWRESHAGGGRASLSIRIACWFSRPAPHVTSQCPARALLSTCLRGPGGLA